MSEAKYNRPAKCPQCLEPNGPNGHSALCFFRDPVADQLRHVINHVDVPETAKQAIDNALAELNRLTDLLATEAYGSQQRANAMAEFEKLVNSLTAQRDALLKACREARSKALAGNARDAEDVLDSAIEKAKESGAPAPSVNAELLAACKAAHDIVAIHVQHAPGSAGWRELHEKLAAAIGNAEKGGVR